MKHLYLNRIPSKPFGTFGVLHADDANICTTLEPAYAETGLIPEGTYTCEADNTGVHRYFKVLDVPGRTDIEFHKGNRVRDTKGCILLGTYFGRLYNENAQLSSGDAFKELYKYLEGDTIFKLTIQR